MRAPARAKARERGFTLIEMMVAMAILSIIALALSTFLIDMTKVNFRIAAETGASTRAQTALDQMRWRLEQSRMLLDVDSGYLDYLDLASAPPPEGTLRLPRIMQTGAISPRAAGGKEGEFDPTAVGNALFFVEALPPFHDAKTGRTIDCFRFVLYYLAQGTKHQSFGPLPDYVELLAAESPVYADFAQLDAIPEETRGDVIRALAAKEITWAWEANAPPKGAFSRLDDGAIVIPPEPHHKIPIAKVTPAIDALGTVNEAAGNMSFSVATNTPGLLPIHTTVPKFAVAEPGFPNGFEVQITGPSHGRKVFARLVIVANTQQRFFSRESQMLASVWD